MTASPPTLASLYQAQRDLLQRIHESLTENDRAFLISVKSGDPDWSKLNTPDAEQLPAVQWKLQNIRRMTIERREEALARLRTVLGA